MVTVIAIDGPAGAGKSTVGRAVAQRFGLEYLDTGAMYRAATFAALQRGVEVADVAAIADMIATMQLELSDDCVVVDGVDATQKIREREVTEAVSVVSANSAVREAMVDRQRSWVNEHGGGVVEGRDIGSVVFPDAQLKLYITASPQVRAERRVKEIGGDVNEVEAAIAARDRYDSTRAISPLVEADGAITVDTSTMSIDDVVEHIVGLMS